MTDNFDPQRPPDKGDLRSLLGLSPTLEKGEATEEPTTSHPTVLANQHSAVGGAVPGVLEMGGRGTVFQPLRNAPERGQPIPRGDPQQSTSFRPRLTVKEMIYHQLPGEQPFSVDDAWTTALESSEQPYSRPGLTVTGEWKHLSFGWVEEGERGAAGVGMVHLRNLSTDPSTVVEVATQLEGLPGREPVYVSLLLLPPEESARWRPADPGNLHLRVVGGGARKAKVTVTALPR